jgi:3-oxoacyl-[acyl-carrier-protein] synthase II
MKRVFLTAAGMVSGLGSTLTENWQRLQNGQTAIKPITYFDTSAIDYRLSSAVPDLRTEQTNNFVQELARRAIKQIETVPQNTFVIWTGIKGNAQYIESGLTQDTLHLPRHYRHWIEERYATTAGGMEVNAACASSAVGVALGAQRIALGEQSSVLVCGADLASRFVHLGFSALKALTATAARPFDENRDGLVLGDGATALLLMDEQTAGINGFTKLAEISGWGISNDANHITGPARDGIGLILSIRQALEMAALDPEEVQALCAHGTATRYNDGMELTAVETLFGSRRFPVFSVKGSIGHTLGAAGGIETALSAWALKHKTVLPTVGLQEAEERAKGRVSAEPQIFEGENILTTNSGFGGVNAALLLRKVEE